MINTVRKFKHMSNEKLTEIGFCPSIKNQVEAFVQAGRVLAGAQANMFHFKDDNIDPSIEPEELYSDKLEQAERSKELSSQLAEVSAEKNFLEKSLKIQEANSKKESKKDLNKENNSDKISEDKA